MKLRSSSEEGAMEVESLEPGVIGVETVERHDGGERQDVLIGSILLYTTMKIPTVT